jgi:hypothetical protein
VPDPIDPRPDFETRLQREVDRILADPAFERSPVQSRLLQYLCEQTVARNRSISQVAVAVDGLGRPETIEQLTESYPRVQISRLRRNLALYYARVAPGEGLAVYIRHGDYQLRLAAPESAYPERPSRGPAPPAANDAPAPRLVAPPPSQPAPVTTTRPPPAARHFVVAAAMVVLVALAGLWFLGPGTGADAAPALEVQVARDAAGGAPNQLLLLAAQQAGDVAETSYVVRSLRTEDTARKPDYVVKLERSQNIGAMPTLNVSLFDRDNERLFRDVIPISGDQSALLTRLNGSMIHIVGPAGVIAQRELSQLNGDPRSDYECVLQTESDRLLGVFRIEGVRACLNRFPQSEYRAYWQARLAFMAFRGEAMAGRAVQASGPAWQDMQQAFAADSVNPFANYVAAKVAFARGDCVGGRAYLERTLTNGSFHGTMTAAALSDAALCPGSGIGREEAASRVAALVDGIPEPNPLQHLYLIFATAAVDRPDLARRVLAAPVIEVTEGPLAEEIRTVDGALAGPTQFEANRSRLQRVIDTFYWGPDARRALIDKLAMVAGYGAFGAKAPSGQP